MGGEETTGKGGRGNDDHNGQVILGMGSQPPKYRFGGQHTEFSQPQSDLT